MRKSFTGALMLFASLLFVHLANAQDVVDPTTLNNKIMAGYQGWFGAAGDGSGHSWIHWSRSGATPDQDNITFDMWPDMREYEEDELFATNFVYSDLSNAGLFSSYTYKTVERHVKWMKDYGIDGVFVQRFISSALSRTAQRDTVLQNVRRASEIHGRVFANMYDMSGGRPATFAEDCINDWKHLVDDLKITESPNYLHHNGLPVLSLWGVHAGNSKDEITSSMWAELLQWLTVDAPEKYRVTLKAGVNNGWRTDSPDWQDVYDKFEFISPWAVGRYNNNAGADNYRNQYFETDLNETASRGMEYIPVVFPGFSWANLYPGKALNQIPRRGGDFFWHQLYNAIDAGCNMVYIAMFDEVDEGTAIFKIAENSSQIPTTGRIVTLDMDGIKLPSDWYLRLTGEASRMLRGEIPLTSSIPLVPFPDDAEFVSQDAPTILIPGAAQSISITMMNTGTTSWSTSDNYVLAYTISPGNNPWGSSTHALGAGESIAPGESKTFTFEITAPAEEGVYKFQWSMQRDSLGTFGNESDLRLINVSTTGNLLDDCDALDDWNPTAKLSLNGVDQRQGSGCVEFIGGLNDSVEFQKVFTDSYNSGITEYDAVLQFWYYNSNAALMGKEIQVQLGSGGAPDTDSYEWILTELNTGWNLVTLKVREAEVQGMPELSAINWFSLTNVKAGETLSRIDEIQVFDMNAGAQKFELQINSGAGDGRYVQDEIVAISADEAPPAQQFIGWVIDSGTPLIEDIYAEKTTLRMTEDDVVISARYKVLGIYLDDCDLLKDWGSSGSFSLNTEDQKEGLGCLEFNGEQTDEYKKVFSTPYNSGASVESGKLQFWYYVSDVSRLESSNQVEIGSAGRPDQNEFNWNIGELTDGWNFISLDLSAAAITDGEPDMSAINWFRLYHFKSGPVITRIDAIEIVDPTAGERHPLTVYNGTGDGNYYPGIEVQITADQAQEGMMFDNWEITSGSPEILDMNLPTTVLTMPATEVVIKAIFTEIKKYSLTVNGGSGSGSYTPGESIMIFANAAPEGHIFEQWKVDAGSPSVNNINSALTYLTMTGEDVVVSAIYRDPTVSVGGMDAIENEVAIYPNPANTKVYVELTVNQSTEANISMFDLRGREAGKGLKKVNLQAGIHSLTVNVSEFEAGLYLMKIYLDKRIITRIVAIQ